MRFRITVPVLIAVMLFASFFGCSGSGKPYATPEPAATMPAITAGPTTDPSYQEEDAMMANAYTLDENGHYDDTFLTVDIPPFLVFNNSDRNTREFDGVTDNGLIVAFVYTWDVGGEYATDVEPYDFESYGKYLTEVVSHRMKLFSWDKIEVDGHEGVKAVFDYNYDDPNEAPAHVHQYFINVQGWVMSFVASSRDEIPQSVEDTVMSIRFKEGY